MKGIISMDFSKGAMLVCSFGGRLQGPVLTETPWMVGDGQAGDGVPSAESQQKPTQLLGGLWVL